MEERERIARELHDTLLQSFQGLTLHFQRARNLLPERAPEAIQTLDKALDGAERAIVEGRDAIHDLRSPAPAAKILAEEITAFGEELVAKDTNAKEPAQFRIVVEGPAHALRPNAHIDIFRIAREAMRNAFTHSRGRRIETEIAYTGDLFRLRVRDDGKGIDPDERARAERTEHWGLRGILLVDDHPVLRQGVRALAADERDMEFVAEASSGQEAINAFRSHRPDVVLMDLQMPDMNGTDAMIAIRDEFPDARFITLTIYAGDVQISRALKAGARGYLLKSL
jgi:CheY-like chemotaxis protein